MISKGVIYLLIHSTFISLPAKCQTLNEVLTIKNEMVHVLNKYLRLIKYLRCKLHYAPHACNFQTLQDLTIILLHKENRLRSLVA